MADLNKMLKNRKVEATVSSGAVDNIVSVVKDIPIELIKEDPDQPRKTFNQESIESLAKSISERGLLSPLLVKPEGKNYFLIYGNRRLKALQFLGNKTAPCIVREQPLSREELTILQLIENVHREDLSAVEKANSIYQLSKSGMKQMQIAKELGYSQGMISRYIQIIELLNQNPKITSMINKLGVENAYKKLCAKKEVATKTDCTLSFSIKIKNTNNANEIKQAITKTKSFLAELDKIISD